MRDATHQGDASSTRSSVRRRPGDLRRHSPSLARLRRASQSTLHRSEVCKLRLQPLQRLYLQLAHPLAREPKLARDRLERLRLALKAESTLDDQPLPVWQPFEPSPHRLPEKGALCLLDGVGGSRIGKEVRELGLAVCADRFVQRGRDLCAAKRLADVSEQQTGCLGALLHARLAAEC